MSNRGWKEFRPSSTDPGSNLTAMVWILWPRKRKPPLKNICARAKPPWLPTKSNFFRLNRIADGGYWVTSGMSDKVVSKVFETSPMRNIASVETISTDALEIPNDLSEANAAWTTEGGRSFRDEIRRPSASSTIPVHELYAMPKSTQNLTGRFQDRCRKLAGRQSGGKIFPPGKNAAFINGDGVGKPRGILTYPAGTDQPRTGSAGELRKRPRLSPPMACAPWFTL